MKPVVGTAETLIEEVGETKRTAERERGLTERARYDVTRNFNAGSAFWRPFWMFTTITCIAFYVFASIYFYFEWLDGLKVGETWATDVTMADWRTGWIALGGSLFTFATASFLGYSPFRSIEKSTRTLAGTSIGEELGERIRAKLKPKETIVKREPAEIVTRTNTRTGEIEYEEIKRLEGITVPTLTRKVHDPKKIKTTNNKKTYNNLGFSYAKTSTRRLNRAHVDLQRLFNWLISRTPYDIKILETTRTYEKQIRHFNNGTSKTMDSGHLRNPSMAVDFGVINPNTNKVELKNTELYMPVLEIIMQGSKELSIPITSGGIHWGWDFFHIELDRNFYQYADINFDPAIELS